MIALSVILKVSERRPDTSGCREVKQYDLRRGYIHAVIAFSGAQAIGVAVVMILVGVIIAVVMGFKAR